MELLFDNKRSHRVDVPAYMSIPSTPSAAAAASPLTPSAWALRPGPSAADTVAHAAQQPPPLSPTRQPSTVTYLIRWIRDNLLKERVELFMEGDTV